MKKNKPRKKSIENRKAHFNYESMDDLEVGLVLTGDEVKAIRKGQMQLPGSYGRVLQGNKGPELWLVGAQIHVQNGDQQRSRKILAHKHEVERLIGLIGQKGYTLVPQRIYFKHNKVKLLLQIAKGRKLHEKKAKLREKDIVRESQRMLRAKN